VDELEFTASEPLTVGIELELQLVRPHDLDLARGAGDLLARLERRKLPGAVKPEITESMIELNSSVHARCSSLLQELQVMRDALVEAAGALNLRISGGGSHPFHNWADRRIFPTERFQAVLERYSYLAKQFTVFGQHIHIGCRNGDDAIYLAHMLTRHVPHFIVLSAASPFYQGEDTSFQSSRLTAVSAFPLAGHIPFVHDWAELVDYFCRMRDFGIVKSMKDFYWDIRPKPEYGTIEIRVFDTPLTVERAAALSGFVQALASWFLHEQPFVPQEDDYMVYTYNRFQACRFGLEAVYVEPSTGEHMPLREHIAATLRRIAPHAQAVGAAASVDMLRMSAELAVNDARWLRDVQGQQRLLAEVVRQGAQRFRGH
jgi:carboxylate-amine ligase